MASDITSPSGLVCIIGTLDRGDDAVHGGAGGLEFGDYVRRRRLRDQRQCERFARASVRLVVVMSTQGSVRALARLAQDLGRPRSDGETA